LKISRFLPGIAWLCTSFYLFTLPGDRFPKITWFEKIYGDKIVHVGIFTVLIALFLVPFLQNPPVKIKRTAFLLALCGILYGIAIEFIQGNFIPNRSFDLWDIAADTAGSFIPLLLLPFFKQTRIPA
jgi:VanZ family protein